ncbi:MAG: hypothetical protein ACHQK9_09040, partial [Reyranellales bacterium]
ARSPSMSRVSRDARLLFVLLWTIVDDEGRCHAALDDLAQVLYPSDFDASIYLLAWLDELEREDCIERYTIDDLDYLRIVHWQKHQRIYHPTPSHLPPPPHEGLDLSGIREISGKLCGRDRKMQADQALADGSCTFPENSDFSADADAPVVVTAQTILHDLRRIQRNAEADGSHSNALRSVAMQAEFGLPTSKPQESAEPRSPTLAELHGMTKDDTGRYR